jgi:hypothetical protein
MTTRTTNFAALAGIGLGAALTSTAAVQAQTLFLDPPRRHLTNRPYNGVETLTINLMVDFGIERAVGWGTDIALGNTQYIEFVPDFGGAGKPFLSTQSFFDTDFSDYSDAGIGDNDAILHLTFVNFADPSATFGNSGRVTLGQFQVRIKGEPGYPDFNLVNDPNAPFWRDTSITLSPLGIPPDGSAVQDIDGNNLLVAASGAVITSRPPTPEPAAWLTMAMGVGGMLFLRRRAR